MPTSVTLIGSYVGAITGSMPIVTSADVAAGERILLFSSIGVPSTVGVSDSAGNTWTFGGTLGFAYSTLASPLLAGGTITVTTTSPDGASIEIAAFRVTGTTGTLVDNSATSITQGGNLIPGSRHINTLEGAQGAGVTLLHFGRTIKKGAATWAVDSLTPAWNSGYTGSQMEVYSREITGDGATVYNYSGTWSWATDFPDQIAIQLFTWQVPAEGFDLSEAFSPTGRRLRAYTTTAGALKVDRMSDALPPTVAETLTLETSGVTACSMERALFKATGKAGVAYIQSNVAKLRTSRDGGRTWSVADTIATGYQDIERVVDVQRGIALVALWKESDSKIYLSVGTLNSGGTAWSYTTPAIIVSNARRGFSLWRESSGKYALSYRNTSDALATVYCRSLSKAGSGSWS